jgi:hypothetical protein
MAKPNWREWKHIPEMEVWKACALSVDIDPNSMESERGNWMTEASHGPFFTTDSFPSTEIKEEFALRLRVLKANLGNREYFTPGILSMIGAAYHYVQLDEFAYWAVNIMGWQTAPPEFIGIATQRKFAESVSSEQPSGKDQPTGVEKSEHWKMIIQSEAANLWKRLVTQGCSPSISSIVDDMAKWCREKKVLTGGDFYPSREYLRRHVLSKKHWTPPK